MLKFTENKDSKKPQSCLLIFFLSVPIFKTVFPQEAEEDIYLLALSLSLSSPGPEVMNKVSSSAKLSIKFQTLSK